MDSRVELLTEYGDLLDGYEGHGVLGSAQLRSDVAFAAGQLLDGRVLLACAGGPEAFGAMLQGPTHFAGTAGSWQLSAIPPLVETLHLGDFAGTGEGAWAVYLLRELIARIPEAGVEPTEHRYLITNWVFDGGKRPAPERIRLPGVNADVELHPLAEQSRREDRLRALRSPLPTGELRVFLSDQAEARDLVRMILGALSIGRGTKLEWIREDQLSGERLLARSHTNRVTRPYSTFAPIHPYVRRGTLDFLVSVFGRYRDVRERFRLERGTIDSVLDAKVEGDFLETRASKLALALELLKHNVMEAMLGDAEWLSDPSSFEALAPAVAEALRDNLVQRGVPARIAKRIANPKRVLQLNRRSFSDLLGKTATNLGLRLTDGDLKLFVACRNSLIHTGRFYCVTATDAQRRAVPPKVSKWEEYLFMISVLDRFLLKLVGFEGSYVVQLASGEWEERVL